MKRIGKLKHRVTALLMSFLITSGLIAPTFSIEVKAEALSNVLESSSTIADCVMSYYAMSGSAMANSEWISTLYSSLGSSFGTLGELADEGLMFFEDGVWKPAEQLATNIESTSAFTELGLDTVFNVSAEEAQAGGGLMAATGGTTLAGAAGCVATHGILPVLGGVTAAYWGGIALGTLIAHKLGLYEKPITYGVEVGTDPRLLDGIPAGGGVNSYHDWGANGSIYFITRDPDVFAYCYLVRSSDNPNEMDVYSWTCLNCANENRNIYEYNANKGKFTTKTLGKNSSYSYNSYMSYTDNFYLMDSNDLNNLVSRFNSGELKNKDTYSPDMISENGNLEGSYDSENETYTVPDMKPQIDTGVEAGKPLRLEDWQNFANGVSNNNSNTNPLPNNKSLFQNILDSIKTPIPSVNPDPGPDPGPNPGGETYPVPGPVPNPTPVPDNDYQPETKPQPEYTEKATENQTDITEGDPYTTPDLLDRFPFCIPRDIYRVFTKLDSGARSAPHIQWRFHPNDKIDYTFDVDFAEWDSIAVLLRTLELLGFIVALAVATRKLILG